MKEIHTFIAQEREHLEAKMICVVLDELTSLLKNSGYPPDICELTLRDENG